jgi:bacillithiol system protein YtxJ
VTQEESHLVMPSQIVEIKALEELDAVLAHSATRPTLIFKHSPTCGTSAQAHEEIESLLDEGPVPADVYLISVRASRAVSNAVAERFNLRHESPQVLLVREGAMVWNASHFRVTAASLRAALRALAPAASLPGVPAR